MKEKKNNQNRKRKWIDIMETVSGRHMCVLTENI